nr:hypothetical protein BHI3_34250 [Bacteriovorax sp. HI3]
MKVAHYLKIFGLALFLSSCGDSGKSLSSNSDTETTTDEETTTASYVLSGGEAFMCIKSDTGVVKCWGKNDDGQLGNGTNQHVGNNVGDMGDSLLPVDLGTGRTAKELGVGRFSSCAILDNNSLKCWGDNGYGQLGLGNTQNRGDNANEMGDNLPAVSLGTGVVPAKVGVGENFTCILTTDGRVKCWGAADLGAVGTGVGGYIGTSPSHMGDNLQYINFGTGRTAKSISLGGSHACAILDNNKLKCWGFNFYGGLGLGDTTDRGAAPNQMGDNLPYVDLGTGRTVKSVAGGGESTCAILDDNSVKCWGDNSFGQLGLGGTNHRGDGANEMGDNLPTVNLGSGRYAVKIASNGANFCAVLDDQSLKCWGRSTSGNLGIGNGSSKGGSLSDMGDALPFVDLGTDFKVVSVASHTYGFCAVNASGRTKCWGGNYYGNLGLELPTSTVKGDASGQMGDNLPFLDLGSNF